MGPKKGLMQGEDRVYKEALAGNSWGVQPHGDRGHDPSGLHDSQKLFNSGTTQLHFSNAVPGMKSHDPKMPWSL